jgi:hypothetical protein
LAGEYVTLNPRIWRKVSPELCNGFHPQWLNLTQLFAGSNYRGTDKGPWTLVQTGVLPLRGGSKLGSETKLWTRDDATRVGSDA